MKVERFSSAESPDGIEQAQPGERPAPEPIDRVLWRSDLRAALGCSPDTLRRYIRDKKLPAPDVHLSQRTMGWKLSTLRAAGMNLI